MARIGILGGSFNPVHHGHLLMAELAHDKMRLDQVVFIPANCSPFKSLGQLPSGQHRLNMIKAAIAGNAHFSVSDLELKRGGPSYTIDTLRVLRQENPKAKLFWIIGEDNITGLKSWKNFDEIISLASFVAISRLWFNISSSEIRRRLKQKRSIRYMAPDRVVEYINTHKLYQ